MKIANQTKSFMNLTNSESKMESSIEIKYSAKDITAPTGYEETKTMISLDAISLGY